MSKKTCDSDELRFLHCVLAVKASKSSSRSTTAALDVANSSTTSSFHVCVENLTKIIELLRKPEKEMYLQQCIELKFDRILLDIIVRKSSHDKEIELSLKIVQIIIHSYSTEITTCLTSLNFIEKIFDLLSRRPAKHVHDASCALLSELRQHVNPHLAINLLSISSTTSKKSAFIILENHVSNVGFVHGKLLNIDDSEWEERVLPQLLRALIRPDAVQFCSAELVISIMLAYNNKCQRAERDSVSSTICTRICEYISCLFVCSMFPAGNALLANSNYAYDPAGGEVEIKTDPSSIASYILERILVSIEDDQSQSIPLIDVSAIFRCLWKAGTHYAMFLRNLFYLKGETLGIDVLNRDFFVFVPSMSLLLMWLNRLNL